MDENNLYGFLTEHQDKITTGTAHALARDLGIDLDLMKVADA